MTNDDPRNGDDHPTGAVIVYCALAYLLLVLILGAGWWWLR